MLSENLRYRDAPQRRSAIMEHLRAVGFLTIGELAERLGVSEMTIRRDARRLHEDGDAIASRGALRLPTMAAEEASRGTEYQRREQAATTAKIVVGQTAAVEIRPDDVIAIDAGTTAFQVATALPDDFAGTVVTHSIPVVNHLLDHPEAKTIALGGDIYRPSQALVGSVTIDAARGLKVRTFYLGVAAVDERGLYASADVERLVKLTLMNIADRVVLVIDHSKFAATAPVFLCGWDVLETVVSDQPPPPHIAAMLAHKGIKVLLPSQQDSLGSNQES